MFWKKKYIAFFGIFKEVLKKLLLKEENRNIHSTVDFICVLVLCYIYTLSLDIVPYDLLHYISALIAKQSVFVFVKQVTDKLEKIIKETE